MDKAKIYRFLIGIAVVCFAIRLVTEIQLLSVIGWMFLLVACVMKIWEDCRARRDAKSGGKKKKKK